MLNYVLETTGQTELFYAGHSMGTVMGFAGFTVNQTLAKQIKAFFALAPVTTVKHAKGLFAFIGEKLIIETIKVRKVIGARTQQTSLAKQPRLLKCFKD